MCVSRLGSEELHCWDVGYTDFQLSRECQPASFPTNCIRTSVVPILLGT